MALRLVPHNARLTPELEQVAFALYAAARSRSVDGVSLVTDWISAHLSQEIDDFDYLTFGRIARTGKR